MCYTTHYQSPLGDLLLASDGHALTGLWFSGQKYFAAGLPREAREAELPIFRQTKTWLDQYFSGQIPDSLPPLKPTGTPFQKEVWNALLSIPYGETTTYGSLANTIAAKLGKPAMSPQAIGSAVGRNPVSILIPCHRVLASNGALTGYAGGLKKKQFLLQLESSKKTG